MDNRQTTLNELVKRNKEIREKMTVEKLQNNVHDVHFDKKQSLINGINTVAKAVGSTLGPKGRLVMMKKENRIVGTKDGVTVADNIVLEDVFENYGASLLLEAAQLTADTVGDGTTTTVLLTDFLLNSLRFSENSRNFYDVQKGMNKAVSDISKELKNNTIPIDLDYIRKIAYTSSNNNSEIAASIIKVYKELPSIKDANVVFYKTDNQKDEIEVEFGYKIDHGSPMITNKVIKNNVVIVLLDYKVEALGAALGRTVWKQVQETKSPVLYICRDYSEEFISDLKRQSKDYSIPMYAIRVDMFGRDASNQMLDIAHATNAEILEEPLAVELPGEEILGRAKKVIFNRDSTNILFEEGVEEYIEMLEETKSEVKDEIEKLSITKRIEKLKSVTANYYVGGTTIQEMESRYYMVEDALLACKASSKGVVIGGGVTPLKIYNILKKPLYNSDYELGYHAVIESLQYPFAMLCRNSYINNSLEMYDKITEKEFKCVYNFATESYEEGDNISIYDPAQTLETSLKAAVSVVSTIILTSAIII